MKASSSRRDPRSIITPDAFEVSADLIGLPLATPGRRAVAMMIDGVVIGFITLVTRSNAMILGVVAAFFFMRAGFKRTPVRGSVFGRAMRFSVGCLGIFIALMTAGIWSAVGFGSRGGDEGQAVSVSTRFDGLSGRLARALVMEGATRLSEAETLEAAEGLVLDLIEASQDVGVEREQARAMLIEATPDDAAWSDELVAFINGRLPMATSPAVDSELVASLDTEVASYTTEEALAEYTALLSADPADPAATARRALLEARLGAMIAADTLGALRARIEDLRDEVEAHQRAIDRSEAALEEATGGGLFNWLRAFVDELGFGFGWAAMYMTVFLSWWNGQTVGKKVMRIRVLRLDGEPINWWIAFERAGGYAAGFATGLLGFAQVWWDANRQAIHDRIVGTVVVVEGGEKVSDWESAL